MTQMLEILPFPLLSVIHVRVLLLQPCICCQHWYHCVRLPRNSPKIRKRSCRQQYSECQLCVTALFLLPEHLIQESKVLPGAQAAVLPVSTEIAAAVSVAAADLVGGVPTAQLCPVLVLLLGWVCIQLLDENFTWKRGRTGKIQPCSQSSATETVQVQNRVSRVKDMSLKEFVISETVGKRTSYNLLYELGPFFLLVLL